MARLISTNVIPLLAHKTTYNMGRTRDNNSSSLKIALAAPPGRVFAPRDTITGRVVRRSPIVSPEATVTLWLEGRVQTEIKQGRRDSIHGVCWYPLRLRTQYLFHGPLHLSRDSGDLLSWPFSTNIPIKPNNHPLRGSRDYNYINVPVLLGTAHVGYESFDSASQGYVEYYLSANLQYTRGCRSETDLATKPIILRHPLPEAGFAGSKTARGAEKKVEVRSQRLLSGDETPARGAPDDLAEDAETVPLVQSAGGLFEGRVWLPARHPAR